MIRGHGRGQLKDDSVQEGADFFVEQAGLILIQNGDNSLHLLTGQVIIQGHRTADRAVPALGGRDAQGALGAQHHGVPGGVQVHGPGNAEVQHQPALQADKGRGEVIHIKARGVLGLLVLSGGAKEVGGIPRGSQRPGIAHGVEHHVQGIASNVTQGADACGLFFNEGAVGNAAAAASAGLDVIDFSQGARFHDLLDLLHVGVHARLKADGQQLAAGLLRADDVRRLLNRRGHRLFQQHIDARIERVDGTYRVLGVVGAYADCVQLLVVQHGLVVRIEIAAGHTIARGKFLSLAGDQVCHGNNLNIRLL